MRIYRDHSQVWIDEVQTYIDELYTYQQAQKLEVPIFFIRFLHLLLHILPIPTERACLYGVATTLLKMGLDMHTQDNHQPMDVLAGDYLSIQFYCLLSEQREVEGIHHVAKTISDINEGNMEHHIWSQQGVAHDVVALHRVQRISSALILSVANFFYDHEDREVNSWRQIIPRAFLLYEADYWQYQFTTSGEEFIQETTIKLEEAISQLKSKQLQEELYHLLINYQILSVKEGLQCEESALCRR